MKGYSGKGEGYAREGRGKERGEERYTREGEGGREGRVRGVVLLTKASDVQYSDVMAGALKRKALVHPLHNEVKET